MNVLVLDPALSTGYCIISISHKPPTQIPHNSLTTNSLTTNSLNVKNSSLNVKNKSSSVKNSSLTNNSFIVKNNCYILLYGHISVDNGSDYEGDCCIDIMNKVKEIIKRYNINYVAIEDFYFSSKSVQGSKLNISIRTAIYIAVRECGLEYSILDIQMWKKHIAGRSIPTKKQIEKWGNLSNKIYIQDALWNKYRIKFPNHSLSKKTGKPILFRYDIVDAVAMAIYYAETKHNINNVICLVEPLPDQPIKTNKVLYVYE
jgi:hypothetical protein